jgi:hypothetical protein
MGNRGNFALIFSQRTRTEEGGNAITVLGKKAIAGEKKAFLTVPVFRCFACFTVKIHATVIQMLFAGI